MVMRHSSKRWRHDPVGQPGGRGLATSEQRGPEIERRMAEHPPRGCSFVSCNWRSKTRNSSALKATEIRDFLLALMAEANAELKSLLA